MIQTTTRLSRGARLRRRSPGWIYLAMIVGGIVVTLVSLAQHLRF
jgi:hypothetical protein